MSIRGLVFPGPALSQLDPAQESSTLDCSYSEIALYKSK